MTTRGSFRIPPWLTEAIIVALLTLTVLGAALLTRQDQPSWMQKATIAPGPSLTVAPKPSTPTPTPLMARSGFPTPPLAQPIGPESPAPRTTPWPASPPKLPRGTIVGSLD
jgi:hypothetical protein